MSECGRGCEGGEGQSLNRQEGRWEQCWEDGEWQSGGQE